jgi:hypothetical protein
MSSNGFNSQIATATPAAAVVSAPTPRRRIAWLLSSVMLRLLIAFIISSLIIMVFFVTVASSR